MRTWATLAVMALLMALSSRVWAAHLEKLDEQIVKDLPSLGQSGGPCSASLEGGITVTETTNRASIDMRILAQVRADEASCNESAGGTLLALVGFLVVGDGGESPGTPLELCFSADHALAASDAGAGFGRARLGGFVITDPSRITRNAAVEYSNGPLVVEDGQNTNRRQGQFPISIGDTIVMTLGNSAFAESNGIGSARASTRSTLSVNLGPCTPVGAPAMSPLALGALAVGLAGLGALLARRRRT
jgi:hypothetical protein